MTRGFRRSCTASFAAAALLLPLAKTCAGAGDAPPKLAFEVTEGFNLNAFLREGPVAAHLLLRSGHDPRILVAFPAGNSGVGLWFARTAESVNWTLRGPLQPRTDQDEKGRALHGIVAEVIERGADLSVREAVLSSVGLLRDYPTPYDGPPEIAATAQSTGQSIRWARPRADGAAGYRLTLEITHGELHDRQITAGADGSIGLRITALTGEVPLTPLPTDQLLESTAAADPPARNALSFLSYREKFLAGSWRFETYFGRDTLMSVRLLMPVLTPLAVESGLGSVLTRLSNTGEVAHEEEIGESAVLHHLHAGRPASDTPIYHYQMIDGNFMLAPVIRAWLLDDARGRGRAAAFLAAQDGREGAAAHAFGVDLVTNLRLVLNSAAPFAADPQVRNLLALKAGRDSGQWRDSGEGLGRGRIPYDVNAVFMPAALLAASALYRSGLLDPYLAAQDRELFERSPAMARIWEARAAAPFDVTISNGLARRQVAAYARSLGLPVAAALDSIGSAPVRFHALSLNADGTPVQILHSDEGFELLFGQPDAATLDRAVSAIMRPFPAGLMTEIGLLVADPVFAPPDVQTRFSRNAYHGTVVWSWQQAVLAAGLALQLERSDLPGAVRQRLRGAQSRLWRAIDAAQVVRNSELWSWNYSDGHYRIVPFGANEADVDESNAIQLWSTVYLAIPEPAP